MKTHLRQICVTLTALVAALSLRAAGENPAPASAAPAAATPAVAPAEPAPSAVQTELKQLVDKIKTKLRAGSRTEAMLAEELKGFDAILAAHKGEQSEDLAQVLMMKAGLYIEVFQNAEKGEALVKQIKTDYPNTELAKQTDNILAMLAQRKESEKMKAAFAVGAIFPGFEEKDLNGQPLSIAKFKGKIVLVDFWATWCGPCVNELPNVIAAYNKYHAKGFEIVGISLDKDEAALKKFIEDKKMPWPQYFDGKGWQSKLGQKYSIDSIPATFLLDGDGKIIAKNLRGSALEAELEKHLGK
ncbi:MAG: TlpA disulfide reductase family protein [Nibricoccus sp.]